MVSVVVWSMLTALSGGAQESKPTEIADYFEERTFQYTAGKYQNAEIRYRLHTPDTVRYGHKYPLVIHLHGLGEAGSDNVLSLLHFHSILPVLTGPKQQNFFMLVVQCPSETPHWYFQSAQDGTLDVLTAIMEHVIAENPIDRRRLTVTGVSSGGWGVWTLISKYPDTFAGAVPTASSAPSHFTQLSALKHTPIWALVNKGDALVSPESVREAMHMVNSSGGSMLLTEINARGHNAWCPAMETYNCLQWMLAQKKGSWFPPPPGVTIHKPRPLLTTTFMFFVPLAIIVILSWGTVCRHAFNAFHMKRNQF